MFNTIYHPRLWKSVSFKNRDQLPKKPGLYCIKSFGRLGPSQYLGKSVNIFNRWNAKGDYQHGRFDQASMLAFSTINYIELDDIDLWERRVINRLNPPWNDQRLPAKGKAGAIWWGLKRTQWRGVCIVWFTLTLIGVLALKHWGFI